MHYYLEHDNGDHQVWKGASPDDPERFFCCSCPTLGMAQAIQDALRKAWEAQSQYGTVAWGVGDVQGEFTCTEQEAYAVLSAADGQLCDRMIEVGWEVLREVGTAQGLQLIEEPEEEYAE